MARQAPPNSGWIERLVSVARPAQNRKFVLAHGVGFPAVGSICGTSNADVAKRLEGARFVSGEGAASAAALDEAGAPVARPSSGPGTCPC